MLNSADALPTMLAHPASDVPRDTTDKRVLDPILECAYLVGVMAALIHVTQILDAVLTAGITMEALSV